MNVCDQSKQWSNNHGEMPAINTKVYCSFQLRHSSILCHTNRAAPDTSPSYSHPNSRSCSHFSVKITRSSCVGTKCQEWFHHLELPRKRDTRSAIYRNGESVCKADFCFFLTVHKMQEYISVHWSGQSDTSPCNCQTFEMLFIVITQWMLNLNLLRVRADYCTSLLCIVQDTDK